MIPADLAQKTRRWTLTASVREDGFRSDQAEIEYASIDIPTFQAVADTLNDAADIDMFDIVVTIDGVETLLFRGTVLEWRLRQEWHQGQQVTVGVLKAQDARGILLTTAAPLITFQNARVGPADSAGVQSHIPRAHLHDVFDQMYAATGVYVAVPSDVDYAFEASFTTLGMTWGEVIASAMAPIQENHRVRVDFVRRGDIYVLQGRIVPLGTPEVTIDLGTVSLRDYTRTRPKPEPVPTDELGRGSLVGSDAAGMPDIQWPDTFFDEVCVSFPTNPAGISGQCCFAYTFGRIIQETCIRVIPAGDGTSTTVEDVTDYDYSVSASGSGILSHKRTTTTVNGILEQQTDWDTDLLSECIDVQEVTVTQKRRRSSAGLYVSNVEVVTKSRTDAGTAKTSLRTSMTESGTVRVEAVTAEFSPGHTGACGEVWPINSRQQAVTPRAVPAAAAAALHHVVASWDMPLDLRVFPGVTVGFSDVLVDQRDFYVTQIEANWEGGQGQSRHRMRVTGEAFG